MRIEPEPDDNTNYAPSAMQRCAFSLSLSLFVIVVPNKNFGPKLSVITLDAGNG